MVKWQELFEFPEVHTGPAHIWWSMECLVLGQLVIGILNDDTAIKISESILD